jgi:hypothetical protein
LKARTWPTCFGWRDTRCPQTCSDLARNLNMNESALYRILRLLASQSMFEEKSTRKFANTELSHFLRTGVPGSVRSILIYRGNEFFGGKFEDRKCLAEQRKSFVAHPDAMFFLRISPK